MRACRLPAGPCSNDNVFSYYCPSMKKDGRNVALVLASGGSRGLAHIGAIEVLEENGFNITSISGCSMGALIGGLYACDGLGSFKEWMQDIDKLKIISFMDLTLDKGGFVKGNKIIEELKTIVPERNIENLRIPFTAVATDILHRKEVVFSSGSLYRAIRSSISVPSLFTPNIVDGMVLIDGGVVNPTPIDRVRRNEGDLLVVVDLNGPYQAKEEEESAVEIYFESIKDKIAGKIDDFTLRIRKSAGSVIKGAGELKSDVAQTRQEEAGASHLGADEKHSSVDAKLEEERDKERGVTRMGIVEILDSSSSLMLEMNATRMIDLYKPEVLVRIPKNAYSTLEFDKYHEIVALGREQMRQALVKAGYVEG